MKKKINLELTIFLHIYKTQNSSSEKYEIMKIGNFKIQLNTYVVNEKWNKTLFHIDNLIKRQ